VLVLCDNGGFAVIDRLQVSKGAAHFNNLFDHVRGSGEIRVDFAAHARSMGAVAVEAETLAELEEAFRGARGSGRTTVIVVRTDPNAWTGGDAWWDVGVPEVSEREEVVVARAQHEAERKHQRTGV
jgi:3D-(3,5/4)-trihydroxycyclohexane-1,2-dione acylhydrolase (decyclizing)